MTTQIAYKVLSDAEMSELRLGSFDGSDADRADGFIHLSSADQLAETVDKHFAGQQSLWVVAVDLAAQDVLVKWEPSRGGKLFPHLFGPLQLETVRAYCPLERTLDSGVKLPVAG